METSGASAHRIRRLAEVAAFVAVYIGIGELTDAGIEAYLVLGIPLTLGFQLLVRRRPIRELWVRSGPEFALSTLVRVLVVLLAIYPAYQLIEVITDSAKGEAAQILYYAAAVIGAGAGAYAYSHFSRETWKFLGLCLATAGVIGVVPDILGEVYSITHPAASQPDDDFGVFVTSLLLLIPVVYVMEEVTFRGALDSHAHHEGERHGIWTAIFVSALWGAWHGPVIGWDQIVGLVLFQGAVGTFLSIWWRRSGNLGVSGTTHALADSIRNGMGHSP